LATIHNKHIADKHSTMSSESSLSPPPENLGSVTDHTTTAAQPVVTNKKRKAKTTPGSKRTATQLAEPDVAAAVANELSRAKRRAVKVKVTEESPEDGATVEESEPGVGKSKKSAARRNKKSADEDTPAEVPVSTGPKRGAAKKAIVEEDEIMEGEFDVEISVREIDRSKDITDNNAIVSPTKSKKRKAGDDGDHKQKPKPAKKRAKTMKNEEPTAERTKDIPHIIGAHVSTAGGKLPRFTAYCSRRPKTNMDWTTVV
jgi:hypothetical protein